MQPETQLKMHNRIAQCLQAGNHQDFSGTSSGARQEKSKMIHKKHAQGSYWQEVNEADQDTLAILMLQLEITSKDSSGTQQDEHLGVPVEV